MLQNAQLKSIFDMGLQLFCQQIEKSPGMERTLSSGLVEMIALERRGDQSVDRKILKSLVKMLLLLGLYSKHFEGEFLEETIFYAKEGADKMRELSVLTTSCTARGGWSRRRKSARSSWTRSPTAH